MTAGVAGVRGRYAYLLATTMAMMLIFPFVGAHGGIAWLLRGASMLVVAASLFSVWRQRRVLVAAIALGLGSVVLDVVGAFDTGAETAVLTPGLRLVFFLLVSISIFVDIVRSPRVTMDSVFGACCVYVLLGVAWANAFGLVEHFYPGSLVLVAEPGSLAARGELLYFSIVTLTTVGYGDIAPVTQQARMLAALEGLVAQLYLAIIVARLVGLELSERLSGSSQG